MQKAEGEKPNDEAIDDWQDAAHGNNGDAGETVTSGRSPPSLSSSQVNAGTQEHDTLSVHQTAKSAAASIDEHPRRYEDSRDHRHFNAAAEFSAASLASGQQHISNSGASRTSVKEASTAADKSTRPDTGNAVKGFKSKAPSSLRLTPVSSINEAPVQGTEAGSPWILGGSAGPHTPRTPLSQHQGVPPRHQTLGTPTVTFTSGSPKEEGHDYLASAGQARDRHYFVGEPRNPANSPQTPRTVFRRATQAVASLFMVASPRLPFYSGHDEDSHANDAGSPFTPHAQSPSLAKQHGGSSPLLAFSGPSGLFSGIHTSPSKNSLFSPSLQATASGFGSTSLSPSAANSPGRKGHHTKRSFYKDKDGSLYPSSGVSYDAGFRKGVGVTTAPGKTKVFRVPRSIARLASRRSRVLPAILLCTFVFFYALGSTRTTSLYDAAQQASARQVGRFFEAADARVGHLNPMKWAMQNSAIEERGKQKTFAGSDGLVEKFDVELLDPAGPLAEPGTVGSARKRYASWEGGRKDGRMVVQAGKPHPIPQLMARAKQRWHALKSRQSKTFAEAVREYQRRYSRMPPKGFDRWYAFAKYHDVQLIDEFNIIEEDFRMFRAFTGESFRARMGKLAEETDFAWNIKIKNGHAFSDGQLKDHDRARGVLHLIRKFAKELPDLHIVYNGHDTARMNVGWEERMRLDELVQAGQYEDFNITDKEMKPLIPSVAPGWGMATICPENSAVRQEGFDYGFVDKAYTGHEMPELPREASATVIDSFLGYMDVCNSPQYRHFHSSSSYVFPWHPGPTMPLFTAGVQSHFADIHCIITEQFGLESRHDPTWEEKPFDRLVWRGQTSGPLFDKGTVWKSSHRARLHILSHQEDGSRIISLTDEKNIVKTVEVPNYQLNPLFLDTGFVGPPVQCVKEDGTCDEMREVFNGFDPRISFERASLFKYVLDVDGNSWSGRFPRLMASNAAVVKATIYREFWTDWCIPWLHFIPIQVDYSDLWDVMAFFRGGLGGEGAHDEAAKSIAIAGKNWAREHFRHEDMEAYTFRQYLEYARLWADDREAMTYSGEVEGYEPIWSADDIPLEMV